jgi:hypothetical protein
MNSAQLEKIYRDNVSVSHIAALKAVYNAGWCADHGETPSDSTSDASEKQTAPTSYVKIKKPD